MDISGVLIWYDLLVARTGDWSNVRIWISMKGKWEDWPLAVKYLFCDWYCPDQTIQYLIFPILTLPHRACGVVRPGHWRTFLTWPACSFSHSGLHRQEQSCQTSPTAALPAVSTNLYTARAALDWRRVAWQNRGGGGGMSDKTLLMWSEEWTVLRAIRRTNRKLNGGPGNWKPEGWNVVNLLLLWNASGFGIYPSKPTPGESWFAPDHVS